MMSNVHVVIRMAACIMAIPGCCSSRNTISNPIIAQNTIDNMIQSQSPMISGVVTLDQVGSFPYYFEISSKGNGGLRICNILIKAYDAHDDGDFFEPFLLNIATFTNSSHAGLICSGSQVMTDEVTGVETSRRDVFVKVVWDPKSASFAVNGESFGLIY